MTDPAFTERPFDFSSTLGGTGFVIETADNSFPATYIGDDGRVEIGDLRFFAHEREDVIAWLRHIADRIEAS